MTSSSAALHVTDKNFKQEVLDSQDPVLVDFWAPWCGPCQLMGPVIEELAKEYKGKGVKIAKMNVDEEPQRPSQYNVMSIPTLILFKKGKPAEQMIGVQKKDELKKKIEAFLKE